MSKVNLKLEARTAAAVRQILFENQKGYTYEENCVPPRISDIRKVIQDIDAQIEKCIS